MVKNPTATPTNEPRDLAALWFDARTDEAEWIADRIAALLGTAYRESERCVALPGIHCVCPTRGDEQTAPSGTQRSLCLTAVESPTPSKAAAGPSTGHRPPPRCVRPSNSFVAEVRTGTLCARSTTPPCWYCSPARTSTVSALPTPRPWVRRIHQPIAHAPPLHGPVSATIASGDAGRPRSSATRAALDGLGSWPAGPHPGRRESVYVSIDSGDLFHAATTFLQNVAEDGYERRSSGT